MLVWIAFIVKKPDGSKWTVSQCNFHEFWQRGQISMQHIMQHGKWKFLITYVASFIFLLNRAVLNVAHISQDKTYNTIINYVHVNILPICLLLMLLYTCHYLLVHFYKPWKVRTSAGSTGTDQHIYNQKQDKYLIFHVLYEAGIRWENGSLWHLAISSWFYLWELKTKGK